MWCLRAQKWFMVRYSTHNKEATLCLHIAKVQMEIYFFSTSFSAHCINTQWHCDTSEEEEHRRCSNLHPGRFLLFSSLLLPFACVCVKCECLCARVSVSACMCARVCARACLVVAVMTFRTGPLNLWRFSFPPRWPHMRRRLCHLHEQGSQRSVQCKIKTFLWPIVVICSSIFKATSTGQDVQKTQAEDKRGAVAAEERADSSTGPG